MPKRTIAALVVIETDDARLFPEAIDVSTVSATKALRAAVIDNLDRISRVVAVMTEDEAKLMMLAHAIAGEAAGLDALFERPPGAYRAPCDTSPPFMPGARRPH